MLHRAIENPTDKSVIMESAVHQNDGDGPTSSSLASVTVPRNDSEIHAAPVQSTVFEAMSEGPQADVLSEAGPSSKSQHEPFPEPLVEPKQHPSEPADSQITDLIPPSLAFNRSGSVVPPERAYINVESHDHVTGLKELSRPSSSAAITSGTRVLDSASSSPVSRPQDTAPFPNQAYAALQTQHHPRPYSPQSMKLWANSSPQMHPSDNPKPNEDSRLPLEAISRENSASSTAGLFASDAGSPLRSNFTPGDTQGSYQRQYLHHTHRQVPKEYVASRPIMFVVERKKFGLTIDRTNLAEIGVDSMSGHKLVNHYEIIDELGRGVHGKVKLGRNLENNQHVAIKIVERESKRRRLGRNDNQEAKIKREIAILKKARHPNIVGLLEVIDDPAKKKVYIILELAELGEVRWRVKGEDEITLLEYRRCQREANGVFENDAADQEDQHILETAHRHLERRERRVWQESRRREVEGGEITDTHWSLEHGGESDFDDPTLPRRSSRRGSIDLHTKHDAIGTIHQSPVVGEVQPQPLESQGPTVLEEQSAPPEAESDSKKKRWSEDFPSEEYHTALEGTMYGPYDTSPPRQQTPSVLDSFASSVPGDDEIDSIPDHYRYIPLMTLDQARRAIRDTVLGLEYLHYQGVIHRDIKPANLLQTKDHRIKISDFGVSYLGIAANDLPPDGQSESDAQDHDEAIELAKTVGTPAFYAPELCQTDCIEEDLPPVTGQIDVWALGVTLYCLVFGRVPFHDHNTFVLMRLIAEQDVYIPRQRLKAVDEGPAVSPSSRNRGHQTVNSNKRLSHDLEYEEVSDELCDLLKRLLTKDPRKRIKLTEVKHHPWLLSGIQDPIRWIDESDPSHMTQGKKIQVSKEDVDVAVVPLTIVDRIVDRTVSVARKMVGAFGIGRSGSRRRAKSSASVSAGDHQLSSNASSSSTISQDARRHDARHGNNKLDEALAAFSQSNQEHPLSQSVTASPEMKDSAQFFPTPTSRPESPVEMLGAAPRRPSGFERAPTTGSIRTIRPSDVATFTNLGAATLSALPSTPQEIEMPASGLSGIFGGTKRKILKKVRSREHHRTPSADRIAMGDDTPYGEPSRALSNTVAAGMVNAPPGFWQDGNLTSSSAAPSPISSKTPSVAGPSDLYRTMEKASTEPLSRESSFSSVASRGMPLIAERVVPPTRSTFLPLLGDAVDEHSSRLIASASDDLIARAKEEQLRRLIQERESKNQRRPVSASSQRPQSATSQGACPPSPDDVMFPRHEDAAGLGSTQFSPLGPSAAGYTVPGQRMKLIVNSSSEDHFASGMSQSTSNPSIPSIVSADSSVTTDNDAFYVMEPAKEHSILSSDDTVASPRDEPMQPDESDGYDGDHPLDSGDESDGSFIEMSMKKPTKRIVTQHTESTSPSGQLSNQQRARRATAASIKSQRSGSNNTMQNVLSHSDDEDNMTRRQKASPS
jgi:SNF1-activating kinase 1